MWAKVKIWFADNREFVFGMTGWLAMIVSAPIAFRYLPHASPQYLFYFLTVWLPLLFVNGENVAHGMFRKYTQRVTKQKLERYEKIEKEISQIINEQESQV